MTGVIPVARCVWFFTLMVDIVVKYRRLTSTSKKFVRYKLHADQGFLTEKSRKKPVKGWLLEPHLMGVFTLGKEDHRSHHSDHTSVVVISESEKCHGAVQKSETKNIIKTELTIEALLSLACRVLF